MTKREARKIIHDRLRSKYTELDCRVLEKIVGLVRVKDYQRSDIAGRRCSSKKKSLARLLFKTEGHVSRSIAKLETDGLLIVHREEGAKGQDEYSVNLENLTTLSVTLPLHSEKKKRIRAEYYEKEKLATVEASIWKHEECNEEMAF